MIKLYFFNFIKLLVIDIVYTILLKLSFLNSIISFKLKILYNYLLLTFLLMN